MTYKIIFPLALILLFYGCGTIGNKGGHSSSIEISESGKTAKPSVSALDKNGERTVLKARGTEPFWGLEITEDMIRFTSLVNGFEKYHTPAVDLVRAADANVKMYIATTESGTIKIQVVQATCTNAMSGKESGYQVRVEIKRGTDINFTVFEGCGEYIVDYRLNDLWVLEEMEGKAIAKEDFGNEVPNMEIHVDQKIFMGHAGCNRMNGKIFSEDRILRFTDIATTRMMCVTGNQEEMFLKNLRASTHFEIGNNRLSLSNADGGTLIFKKVD